MDYATGQIGDKLHKAILAEPVGNQLKLFVFHVIMLKGLRQGNRWCPFLLPLTPTKVQCMEQRRFSYSTIPLQSRMLPQEALLCATAASSDKPWHQDSPAHFQQTCQQSPHQTIGWHSQGSFQHLQEKGKLVSRAPFPWREEPAFSHPEEYWVGGKHFVAFFWLCSTKQLLKMF